MSAPGSVQHWREQIRFKKNQLHNQLIFNEGLHMKISAFFVILAFVVSGCSSMGGEDKFSSAFIRSHIIANKTTQAEVQSIYGVPDDQDIHSNGSTTWIYNKNGLLDAVESVVNKVPGASSVSNAINMKRQADGASSAVTKVTNKASGETEVSGNTLYIRFNSNKIVSSWLM